MFSTKSRRGRYALAALLGAAAGGGTVALAPRVVPKMMSAMCAKMHTMMAAMNGSDCQMSDTCRRTMGRMEQGPQPAACHASAGQAGSQDEREHS